MEQLLRNMYDETAGGVTAMPYTCTHFMITQRCHDGKINIHMLHEGAYVTHCVGGDEPFEGHPFCPCCQESHLRFLLGWQGNLIQLWSNAQYTSDGVHTVNLYSEGQLMVRSVQQLSTNRCDPLAPRTSATLIRNIETHIWRRRHFPSVGGPRKLILDHPPFREHLMQAKEAVQEAVERLKPFIYLLVVDLYIKFLPDEKDDKDRVRLQWSPITANPEDPTNFGVITVHEDLSLWDIVNRFAMNPNITVYSLVDYGRHVGRSTVQGFESEKLRDLYYQLQQDLGNGVTPYSHFPDGSLKYPVFQVHMAPERQLWPIHITGMGDPDSASASTQA